MSLAFGAWRDYAGPEVPITPRPACVLVFSGAREWRNGRRAGFRCQCPKGRGGSNPPSRTNEGPREIGGPLRLCGSCKGPRLLRRFSDSWSHIGIGWAPRCRAYCRACGTAVHRDGRLDPEPRRQQRGESYAPPFQMFMEATFHQTSWPRAELGADCLRVLASGLNGRRRTAALKERWSRDLVGLRGRDGPHRPSDR